eukprot:4387710-Prorocentrum_lima.AAC.1
MVVARVGVSGEYAFPCESLRCPSSITYSRAMGVVMGVGMGVVMGVDMGMDMGMVTAMSTAMVRVR